LIFKGQLGGYPCRVLFDTGADVSIVSEYWARRAYFTLSADDTHLVMADGTQVKTHGSIRSKLRVSSYIGDVRLRVMPLQPSIDVILGMDWLAKHNARIDTAKKEIRVQSGMKSIIVRNPIMEKKETKTKLVGAVEMIKIIERGNLLELNRCFLVRVIAAGEPAVAPSDYDHILERYKVVFEPTKGLPPKRKVP